MTSSPFTLRIGKNLETPESKRFYNEQVFTEIAPRYDFITRGLSFWRDASWKRTLIGWLPEYAAPVCADLATGTGDIAILLGERYPRGKIIGLDITEKMLILARERNHSPQIEFLYGDMSELSLPPESVDVVTGGYALRNAPDLDVALAEIHRVLKPGGVAAFLDFSKPASPFWARVEYGVLKFWTGLWGILLHRNHEVYSYIAESLAQFPDRDHLHQRFMARGLTPERSQLNFFGITQIQMVRKAGAP